MKQKKDEKSTSYIENNIYQDYLSLVVFRNIREHKILKLLEKLLMLFKKETTSAVSESFMSESEIRMTWSEFLFELSNSVKNLNWFEYFCCLILEDDNPFTRMCEQGEENPILISLAKKDLKVLQKIASISLTDIESSISKFYNRKNDSLLLPDTFYSKENLFPEIVGNYADCPLLKKGLLILIESEDWSKDYSKLITIWTKGSGVFGKSFALLWQGQKLKPIFDYDKLYLDCLVGYEAQRSYLFDNTQRFICEKKAENILLSGEKGTGKTSTVKSLIQSFAESENAERSRIRIVEVKRENIDTIPNLVDILKERPFYFIIFIDNICLEDIEKKETGIRILLDGGLEKRPKNIIVYATTKLQCEENCSTSKFSISDYFDTTLVFSSLDTDSFISMVCGMTEARGISPDFELIRSNAQNWINWFNDSSPHSARQFLDTIESEKVFPWQT